MRNFVLLSGFFKVMVASVFATQYSEVDPYSSKISSTTDISSSISTSVMGQEVLTSEEASDSSQPGSSVNSKSESATNLTSAAPTLSINAINELVATARQRVKLAETAGYSSLSFMQQGAKGKYYDPLTPGNVISYTTSFTYEYTPNKIISFGITPSYSNIKTHYLLIPQTKSSDTYNLSPFVSYFLSSTWLLAVQGSLGYNLLNTSTSTAGFPTTNLDQHALQYSTAVYATWLAPGDVLSGSLSLGATYSSSPLQEAFDNTGVLTNSTKSQRGGPSFSSSLNYVLNEHWIMSFQASIDYSFKLTRSSDIYKSSGGRQRLRVTAGTSLRACLESKNHARSMDNCR